MEIEEINQNNKSLKNILNSSTHTTKILLFITIILIFISVIVLLLREVKNEQSNIINANNDQVEKTNLSNSVTEIISDDIQIINPKNNEVLFDPINIEATVSTNITPVRVEFWIDNQKTPIYTTDEGPYSYIASDLTPGAHTFYVVAYDSTESSYKSKEIKIRISPQSTIEFRGKGEKE